MNFFSSDVNNRRDTLSVSDVLDRIEELEGEREDLAGAVDDARGAASLLAMYDSAAWAFLACWEEARDEAAREYSDALQAVAEWDESEDGEELTKLKAFASEFEGCADKHETLIRESHFEDYAQQLAEDIGHTATGWPFDYVDWELAADALKQDYSTAEFNGVTYYYRS
jgi:hypothetical protein